jgi:dsDNA-binding SOS-regulon protein
MLMVFTMTASAWCCGVRSINLVQAQNQVKQQAPQPAPPVTQPAPAPVPEPETLAELIKADLADFDKFGDNDQETNFDDNAKERLSEAALREVDRFEEALSLPTFKDDTDESRIDRNEKQLDIAENLAPELQQRIISFINDVNTEVSKFVAPENQSILENAPQSVIDSFYDQVSNLHEEFFVDLNNAIKKRIKHSNWSKHFF